MQVVIVAGSSGQHAAVVYEAARLSGIVVAGFVTIDDGAPPSVLDCKYLGGPEMLENGVLSHDASFVVASGSNARRKSVTDALDRKGASLQTIIHPGAIISPSAAIGWGSVVLAGAIVGPLARLGRSCIVNHAASVDHHCSVADHVNISPGARLGGAVQIDEGVFIGLNASILQGLHVGRDAVIGAGAVVIADVGARAVVAGNPARELRR
ncbi:acetyltransferase [Sphingomonas sp.]|uniref:acetyltransferase n=1 Tax=Sphingomonas sp. TaxID=28214 RepID=UPI003D6D8269